MSRLKAPDGTGIKGGIINYHTRRMLAALELADDPEWHCYGDVQSFIADLTYHHARLAARAALNKLSNGRREE